MLSTLHEKLHVKRKQAMCFVHVTSSRVSMNKCIGDDMKAAARQPKLH